MVKISFPSADQLQLLILLPLYFGMANLKSLIFLAAVSTVRATISPGSLVTISTAVDATSGAAWWDPLDEYGGYDWLAYLRNPPGGGSFPGHQLI